VALRPGNSPGDTVVWVPEARAAWTGNLLSHRRTVPMLLEAVTRARRLGLSGLATMETVPLRRGHGFPRWHPAARMNWLVQDLHRLNVLATYHHLERKPPQPERSGKPPALIGRASGRPMRA
jgi:hypothetical protein